MIKLTKCILHMEDIIERMDELTLEKLHHLHHTLTMLEDVVKSDDALLKLVSLRRVQLSKKISLDSVIHV